jgi:hypothetical protein
MPKYIVLFYSRVNFISIFIITMYHLELTPKSYELNRNKCLCNSWGWPFNPNFFFFCDAILFLKITLAKGIPILTIYERQRYGYNGLLPTFLSTYFITFENGTLPCRDQRCERLLCYLSHSATATTLSMVPLL